MTNAARLNKPDEMTNATDFIRSLVRAWGCCGTCAGGVLAARDRERDAAREVDRKARETGEVA